MPFFHFSRSPPIHSGVLWLGEQAIAGSANFIDFLARAGKRIIVLTNNATKSRAVYAKKLAKLGYQNSITEVWEFFNGKNALQNFFHILAQHFFPKFAAEHCESGSGGCGPDLQAQFVGDGQEDLFDRLPRAEG